MENENVEAGVVSEVTGTEPVETVEVTASEPVVETANETVSE